MSYRFSIAPKERKVGRFLGRVRRELQKAFNEEKALNNLNQAKIAAELGVHRSVINRQLMGTENMTLTRVAELAWAMNRDLLFSLAKPSSTAGSNFHRDLGSVPEKPQGKLSNTGSDLPKTFDLAA